MIALFTDFGVTGPYVGQVKAVLARYSPDSVVIDLMHDAPVHNPRASSYLLSAFSASLPDGAVVLAVVDPGVGSSQRDAVVVKACNKYFVGPGNGLFGVLTQLDQKAKAYKIDTSTTHASATFHGRDIFAPVAAKLASGFELAGELTSVEPSQMPILGPIDLTEILYIDHFGNAMTGLRGSSLSKRDKLSLNARLLSYANTFAEAEAGEPFWYVNSSGLVEIAVNCGRAVDYFNLRIGHTLDIVK